MNRRGFLTLVGAFAAGAVLPKALLAAEKITLLPAWAKDLPRVLYRVSTPLVAGHYTFTANAGKLGMYIGGVTALGGETIIQVPSAAHLPDGRLIRGGLTYPIKDWWGDFSMTAEELLADENRLKGVPVSPA